MASLSTGQKVSLGGAGVASLGTFLPWAEVSVLGTVATKRGVEADGIFVLIAAGIIAANVLFADWEKYNHILVVVFGLIIVGISVMYISDPTIGGQYETARLRRLADSLVQPGVGLYISAGGGVVSMAGGWMGYDSAEPIEDAPVQNP